MDGKYGESDHYYIMSEDSNAIHEDIAGNEKSKEPNPIVMNEWQNLNTNSWLHYCNHHPCCPITHSIDGSNLWYSKVSSINSFQYMIPINEESYRKSSTYSQLNPSQKLQKVHKNGLKEYSEDSFEASNNGLNECKAAKIYSCRLCTEMDGISDQLAFRAHIELHLQKDRPFICKMCDKCFEFRSTCRNHMMAHMVVRN